MASRISLSSMPSTMDSVGKRSPHVLIIVENLPVPLDRRVWQEACALRDQGWKVSVICPRMRGYVIPEETLDGIDIYRHWISSEAGGMFGFIAEYASALFGESWLAWKVFLRNRFDVIHICNPPDLLFLVTLPFKWLFGVKVVFDSHDVWPEMFDVKFGAKHPLAKAVRVAEYLTIKTADYCIATNESVARVLEERGGKARDRITVVRTSPKAINTDAPRDESLRKGRKFLVGYVGVMGSADGVQYLIEAADYIVNQLERTDIQFLLMGTGAEYDEVEARRDAADLEAFVDMPGRVSDEFLCSALQTIDLGVCCDPINAYNDKCTMNKTLEYMAFGKPQVLFDIVEGRFSAQEAAEYVGENSGHALGEAIVNLLDDPERRTAMGSLGQKRLREELSWEMSSQQLMKLYSSLSAET